MSAKPILPLRPGLAQARQRSATGRFWAVGVGAVAVGVGNEAEMGAGSLGVHGGEVANGDAGRQGPALAKAHNPVTGQNAELLARHAEQAEALRALWRAGRLTTMQCALRWGVSKTRARAILLSGKGPGSERIAKLPESVRKELEAA